MNEPNQSGQQTADPKMVDAYERFVMAGQKVMYSPQTRKFFLDGLKGRDIVSSIVHEVAGIVKLLDDKAKGKMPKRVFLPAAITLMFDAFKFVEEAGKHKFNNEDIAKGVQMMAQLLVLEYSQMKKQQPPQDPLPPQQGGQPPQPAPQQQPMGLMGA